MAKKKEVNEEPRDNVLDAIKMLAKERGIDEEELIKATWVAGIYKNIWIEQFRKMAVLA